MDALVWSSVQLRVPCAESTLSSSICTLALAESSADDIFRRIKFRDQVAFVDLGAFIDREADHAPRDLRADDHVIPGDDARQRNFCCRAASS